MNYTHCHSPKQILPCIFFLFFTQLALAQMQVTDATVSPITPQNLISNILLGNGVEVTNITFNGKPEAVGYFTGGKQVLGLDRGIIMTSGRAQTQGNNYGSEEDGMIFASNGNGSTATDPNLKAVTTGTLNDVAVYKITFIPVSDTLRFRYVFASEEYPEFACTQYNDIFGFFIQGPGYATPKNIALIPGTNLPVAINNLHPSNPSVPGCDPLNAIFYNDNLASNKQPVYDGFTKVFTAEAVVVPCQQYTITLAIADVGDSAWDSGVFLEAKSFGTGTLRAELVTASPDGKIVEGCAAASVTFRIPNPQTTDFKIDCSFFGTAINGVDFPNIPNNLIIPAGQTELSIPINAIEDNISEPLESFAFDFQRDICTRDTIVVFIKDNALLPPSLRPDTALCQNAPALNVNGTLPIVYPPPPSFSNFQDYQIPFLFGPVFSPITVSGVTPAILTANSIRSVCLNIAHSWDDDIDMYLISPGGQYLELSTDNGGSGDNYTNTCFKPSATKKINFPGPVAPSSAAPFTGDFLPEGEWSDLWDGNYPANGVWQLQLRDDGLGNVGNLLDWTITFEPNYKVDYQWTPIVGVNCPTCPVTTLHPSTSTNYKLYATDSYGCVVSDSVRIDILPEIAAPTVDCASFGSGNATFSWNSVANATGYEVNVNGAGWIPASGNLMHTISGLSNSAPVTLQVRGFNPAYTCTAQIGTGVCCQKPASSTSVTDVSCFGGSNGRIQLTPDGVNPPYAFLLGTQTNSTGLFQNLSQGTYTVTITDGTGCSNVIPVNVGEIQQLTGTATPVQAVSCFGGDNGKLTAVPNGGTAAYTYTWSTSPTQTGISASNLTAGTYTVTITDVNNCTTTASATLTQPTSLSVSALSSLAPCFGLPGGSASASGSGGVPPYGFAWSNNVNGPINNNLPAGNYTITLSDANGCATTAFVSVGQAPAISVTVNAIGVACLGDQNGSAAALASGGTGAFTYSWNTTPPQLTATAINLAAQNYTVTVKDANGCTAVQSVLVPAPNAISATITPVNVDCNQGNSGSLTVQAAGGTSPYTYKWSDAGQQTGATAANLSAGSYTVTITDAKGCTLAQSASLAQPQAIQIQTLVSDASCFADANGKISVTASGGLSPYSYKWSNGATTQNLNNQTAGVYTLTLTDANNCTQSATATIGQPPAITINVATQNVRCKGQASGSILIDLYGGTPGYSIQWTGPNGFSDQNTQISGLFAGVYRATITDAKACTRTIIEPVTEPAAELVLQLPEFADTICFNAVDGKARGAVFGGTPPFTYLWDINGTAQTTQQAVGLPTGVYTLTVTDANLCSQSAQTIVTQQDQLFAVGAYENPNCYNGNDGKARLSAIFYGANTADPALFTYAWSTQPPQNKPVATGLSALGQYTVTLTDAQGCTSSASVTLGNPEPVEVSILDVQNVDCQGNASGSARAVGRGGTAPYQYFWSAGVPAPNDSIGLRMKAGIYFVTVTDAKGCPKTATVSISEPDALRADLSAIPVKCFGGSDGGARAKAKGGVPPYTFSWSTGSSNDSIQLQAAGPVWLNVTDKNGCVYAGNLMIPQPDTSVYGQVQKEDPSCFGGRDGKMSFSGAGGTPPYRYSTGNQKFIGAAVQIGIAAGLYQPQIIDKNGCIATLDTIRVQQPDQVEVELGPDFSIEIGQDTQLNALVLHGIEPYQFAWNFSDTTWLSCFTCPDPRVQNLMQQHWFKIQVVDANGCEGTDRIRISVERPRRIYVPTAFTPNSDGENDRLVVHGQNNAKIKNFRLYDRWGELVYQADNFTTNDDAFGWDGAFRGKACDPGVYVWVVEAIYLDGQTEILHGNSTLIR